MQIFADTVKCHKFSENKWEKVSVPVPKEVEISIDINEKNFVKILCSPWEIEELVLGFLYSEQIIASIKDVLSIDIDKENYTANVVLSCKELEPTGKTFTSGFGKGVMFRTDGEKVVTNKVYQPDSITFLMKKLSEEMDLYKKSGGVHASALADENKIIAIAEDIGRHNTFDKIQGKCLKGNIETKDKIILTTGRISSEMLLKASRMQIPVAVSMKTVTDNAIKLAKELGIALIGQVKDKNFIVYTNEQMIMKN